MLVRLFALFLAGLTAAAGSAWLLLTRRRAARRARRAQRKAAREQARLAQSRTTAPAAATPAAWTAPAPHAPVSAPGPEVEPVLAEADVEPAPAHEVAAEDVPAAAAAAELTPAAEAAAERAPAAASAARPGPADDLEAIKGIGPVIAGRLRDIGITAYAQIASWSEEEAREVAQRLGADPERPLREGWVESARALAEAPGGGERSAEG